MYPDKIDLQVVKYSDVNIKQEITVGFIYPGQTKQTIYDFVKQQIDSVIAIKHHPKRFNMVFPQVGQLKSKMFEVDEH